MSDEAYIIFIVVCFAVAVIATAVSKGFKSVADKEEEEKEKQQQAIDEVYGLHETGPIEVEEHAVVISKSTENHTGINCMVHQIVFQTATGRRLCFAVRDDKVYQTIIEGDKGELRFVGTRLESFVPITQ